MEMWRYDGDERCQTFGMWIRSDFDTGKLNPGGTVTEIGSGQECLVERSVAIGKFGTSTIKFE